MEYVQLNARLKIILDISDILYVRKDYGKLTIKFKSKDTDTLSIDIPPENLTASFDFLCGKLWEYSSKKLHR